MLLPPMVSRPWFIKMLKWGQPEITKRNQCIPETCILPKMLALNYV
ncbi:hypothetical protein OIU76_010311 [Salix suchowensis]|nr:hypothetical protein OIU76_010311 [Salix suchowensis]